MFPDSPGGPQGNVRVGDTFEWSTRSSGRHVSIMKSTFTATATTLERSASDNLAAAVRYQHGRPPWFAMWFVSDCRQGVDGVH